MKEKDQYIWLNTEAELSFHIIEAATRLGLRLTLVPSVDYTSWMGFIYIIAGIIGPLLVPHDRAMRLFLLVPLGLALWAFHILTSSKKLPAGCIPGKTYHKYKIVKI